MRRKLLLVVLLISAVGLGCGCFSEDLCALGGSFVDDPSSPSVAAQFALPNHRHPAAKAAVQLLTALPAVSLLEPLHATLAAPQPAAALAPSTVVPIRC